MSHNKNINRNKLMIPTEVLSFQFNRHTDYWQCYSPAKALKEHMVAL